MITAGHTGPPVSASTTLPTISTLSDGAILAIPRGPEHAANDTSTALRRIFEVVTQPNGFAFLLRAGEVVRAQHAQDADRAAANAS